MNSNAAHADRAWDRLARRGWKGTLTVSDAGQLPWMFTAEKGETRLTAYATSRVEAVLKGAEMVEEVSNASRFV